MWTETPSSLGTWLPSNSDALAAEAAEEDGLTVEQELRDTGMVGRLGLLRWSVSQGTGQGDAWAYRELKVDARLTSGIQSKEGLAVTNLLCIFWCA